MKTPISLTLGLMTTFAASSSAAYELATHGAVTQQAYERSALNRDQQLLKDLGIKDGPNVFGEFYYDVSGIEVKEREQNPFENKIIKGDLGVEELSITGWLLRGAIREDDYTGSGAPNPQDDPYNAGNWLSNVRPLNHFYDPWYDRALTVAGIAWGKKAPNWDLGTRVKTREACGRKWAIWVLFT